MILDYIEITKKNNFFQKKRQDQNKFWLIQTIEEHLKNDFFNHAKIKNELRIQMELIQANETTPFAAADYLLQLKRDL